MPELPEVETTLRGIEPALQNRTVTGIEIRNASLRWPVPVEVERASGRLVGTCSRRAKYLLIEMTGANGGLLIHLGMSGSLRVCNADDVPRKHDHVDILLDDGRCIRFNDPRRFGAMDLLETATANDHKLLRDIGPEPLGNDFHDT